MTSDQDSKRGGQRRKALKSGTIVFNDGQSVISCVVRNLSETGARLECDSFVDCPRGFTLKLTTGPSYECEVRWMTIKAAGVEFMRVIDDAG